MLEYVPIPCGNGWIVVRRSYGRWVSLKEVVLSPPIVCEWIVENYGITIDKKGQK